MTVPGARARWPGRWLWPPHRPWEGFLHSRSSEGELDRNVFIRYRARIQLDRLPESAALLLSADGRYLAFVNGHRIGRGPAASDADVREVDRYDVREHLQPGTNLVAVLVHSYGVDTAWYTLPSAFAHGVRGGGALYAHLDLDGRLALDSPEAWRCQRAPDWQADTPRINESLGFVEVRDARLEPVGWEEVGFDDESWERATACEPKPTVPGRTSFPIVRERRAPYLVERTAAPVAWIASEAAEIPAPEPARIFAGLIEEPSGPLAGCTVDETPEGGLRLAASPGRAIRLLFDFGELLAARPRLAIDVRQGTLLDIATVEQLDATGRPHGDLFGSRHGHRFVLREGPQVLERWDWAGFRYLLLAVHGATAPLTLASVTALSSEDPSPRPGAFACSDETLTRIWDAGARTIGLVTQDLVYGDITREQRQWVGDLQAALGAILSTVGVSPLVPLALRQTGEAEPFGGFLPMYAPGDYRGVATTIPDYTLRWLIALDEYHEWSGDTELVESLYPVVLRSLRAFEPYADPSGLLVDIPYWHFIDWAAVGRDGIAGPINGLYLLALQASARLASAVGHTRESGRLRRLARRVRAAFRERLFFADDGLFGDGPGGSPFSQHTNALALLAGAVPAGSVDRVASALADPQRVRVTAVGRIVPPEDADRGYDPALHLVMAQPGFMGFILAALREAGRSDLAIQLIRDRWAPMVESGTCWETWSGRHSRCHPWSTAPTAELPRILLGVRPIVRGWSKVRIDPVAGGLDWARGRVPTPRGAIGIGWTREDAGLRLELDLPAGIQAVLPSGAPVASGVHLLRPPRGGTA